MAGGADCIRRNLPIVATDPPRDPLRVLETRGRVEARPCARPCYLAAVLPWRDDTMGLHARPSLRHRTSTATNRTVDLTASHLAAVGLIGLAGGTLGGLLGLGGSVFIIPALTLAFGSNQHLYQASALVANVFVASAATWRHRGRGTVQRDVVPVMAIAAAVAAVAGVAVSNLIPARPLAGMFGAFLCYASTSELVSLARRTADHPASEPGAGHRWRLAGIAGAAGGFACGLLGIGGGAVMVPILRKFGRLPLRQAVASSAAAMIAAAAIGAISKNASIGRLASPSGEPLALGSSLELAAVLSPMAMLGGSLGAALVYRLPLPAIRLVLALLLAFSGVRMVLSALPTT